MPNLTFKTTKKLLLVIGFIIFFTRPISAQSPIPTITLHKLVTLVEGEGRIVSTVRWSPDGRYISSLSPDQLSVWDTVNWSLVKEITWSDETHPWIQSWSPTGKYLAIGEFGTVSIWDTNHWEMLTRMIIPYDYRFTVEDVDWSPDERYLVTSGAEGNAQIWHVNTGILIREIVVAPQLDSDPFGNVSYINLSVARVEWSPDGTYLAIEEHASGGKVANLEVWNLPRNESVFAAYTRGDVVWRPDGKEFAYVEAQGVNILNTETWKTRLFIPTGDGRAISWSSDMKYLAVHVVAESIIAILDANSGTLLTFTELEEWNQELQWSPVGNLLAMVDDEGELTIWQLND